MVLQLYLLEFDSIIAFRDSDNARSRDLSASSLIDTSKKYDRPALVVNKTAQYQA